MAIENILEKTVVLPHNTVHILFDTFERFEETYINETREMLAECNECTPEDVTDDWIDDVFWEGLNDEKSNLNVETGGYIIALADLGLWYGRRPAVKIIGSNLNQIFNDWCGCDDGKWYVDNADVRFSGSHHDGDNNVLFRYVDSKEEAEEIYEQILDGQIEGEDEFCENTKSLRPFVAEVYGW